MSSKTTECIWFMRYVSDESRVELSQCLEREAYAPRERLQTDRLTILMRGVAAKGGVILTNTGVQGNLPHWGEDIILNAEALKDRKPAAALTYVEVLSLQRADIDKVAAMFPDARTSIRKAAVYMGVRRSMCTIVDYVCHASALGRGHTLTRLDAALRDAMWSYQPTRNMAARSLHHLHDRLTDCHPIPSAAQVKEHFGDDFVMGAAKPAQPRMRPPNQAVKSILSITEDIPATRQGPSPIYGTPVSTQGGWGTNAADEGDIMQVLGEQGKAIRSLAESMSKLANQVGDNSLSA